MSYTNRLVVSIEGRPCYQYNGLLWPQAMTCLPNSRNESERKRMRSYSANRARCSNKAPSAMGRVCGQASAASSHYLACIITHASKRPIRNSLIQLANNECSQYNHTHTQLSSTSLGCEPEPQTRRTALGPTLSCYEYLANNK